MFSHQYLIAVTVETEQADPDKVSEAALTAAVAGRLADIILHDGREAFSHNDTHEMDPVASDGYPESSHCGECGAMMSALASMKAGLCGICRGEFDED